tara:strand:- start:821 stop:1432 length:612 start_codon:yes stop_codon:yes gene_type:complete
MTRTRSGEISRVTKETDVFVQIDIDGSGKCDVNTGIGFLDHMIQQLSSHGLFDLKVTANGDTHIDDHHTNEDVGIALGQALSKALGDRIGIKRFGHFLAPLDEALIQVVVDCSGRPHLTFDLDIPSQKVGTYDTELVKEFFAAVASNSGLTLHVKQISGTNTHHIVEASFKSFARALRMATEIDPRRSSQIPSSKGVLEQAGN